MQAKIGIFFLKFKAPVLIGALYIVYEVTDLNKDRAENNVTIIEPFIL